MEDLVDGDIDVGRSYVGIRHRLREKIGDTRGGWARVIRANGDRTWMCVVFCADGMTTGECYWGL